MTRAELAVELEDNLWKEADRAAKHSRKQTRDRHARQVTHAGLALNRSARPFGFGHA